MATPRPKLLAASALVAVLLMAGCNNPISNAVSVTASDTTPFGNGQTVYVGFPNTDWYHTGVLKYASNGTGWIQQLSNQLAVTDISVDSSGNIAVAAGGTILYRSSGGSWVTGVSGSFVSLQSSSILVADPTGATVGAYPTSFGAATSSASGVTTTALWGTSSTTAYVGTSSGLRSYSAGAVTAAGSGLASTAPVSSIGVSGSLLAVVTSAGVSINNSGWSDKTASTIGAGTPLCVWASGTNVYVGGTQGVSVSTDSGSTWTAGVAVRSGSTTKQVNLGLAVTSISAATAGGQTCIYMATSQGLYVYSYSNKEVTVAFSGYPINKVFVTVP